ncbi:ALG11 alpha-12-mannosyltransferase [Carabus blaptoides fortunei]
MIRSTMSTIIKYTLIGGVLLTCLLCALIPLILLVLRWHFGRKKVKNSSEVKSVGFFHPYCNAGGGGERVLWRAVQAYQQRYPDHELYVYTGDLDATPADILKRVNNIFNIPVKNTLKFVYLHRRKWVEADMYPYFTLLGQSLGSVYLGFEALTQLQPDIFIDTMGYAFTLPLFKYLGLCKVGCYVHYPTITKDMLRRVSGRVLAHNNRNIIARSPFLTAAKLTYYKLFALIYSWAGRTSQTIMVNSTWTEDHVNSLWEVPLQTHRVYPPCDVEHLKTLKHENIDTIRIISVGQFRPEKDHPLQLRSLYELRSMVSEQLWSKITLVFIGSCRNEEDRIRVKDMQDLCKHLSLEDNVEFQVNVSYEELLKQFSRGLIGLHAMWNEHFGIGVVECMAAGLITVAHRSGGPLMDIIETSEGSRTGYLATTSEDYAHALLTILQLTREQMAIIRNAARASVDRFTSEEFQKDFIRATQPLFT